MGSLFSRYVFVLGTFITIGINSLSALPLNGVTTAQLSDRLMTMITPAGFTFGIRGLIYTSLIIVSIMITLGYIKLRPITIRSYLASCLFNSAWIFARHYGMLALSLTLIVGLVGSLIVCVRSAALTSHAPYYSILRVSLMMYLGWVSIASLLMLTIFLMYNTTLIDGYVTQWSMIVLIIAGILNLLIIQYEKNLTTSLVLLWALYGIMSQPQPLQPDDMTIGTTALVVGSIIVTMVIIECGQALRSLTSSHQQYPHHQ